MPILNILLKDIWNNPWQTRQGNPDMEYKINLALDIDKNGLLQVPIGRHTPGDESSVQLAFGHNRLAAFWWLYNEDNLKDDERPMGTRDEYGIMPVDLRELTDQQMADYAWSENEKRRDVSAIERALAVQKRIEDFAWSQADAANNLGVDRSTVSNLLRLLKLPEGLRANIQAGEISERQAMALLPLFEAPEQEYYSGYSWMDNPEQIIKHAIDGESSDRIRGRVDDYFKRVAKDLQNSVVKLDDLYPEDGGIYCGKCRTCDKRMASRNLCFLPGCFEAKIKYKQREYLSAASSASGYPLSDANKGGSVSLPYGSQMETIRKAGCPNLCLVYQDSKVDEPYNIEGYPHARLVCDKRNNSCSCEKGLNVRAVQRVEDARPAIQMPESIEIDDNGVHEKAPVVDAPVQVTSSDLEEAARQARKDKKYAIEQRGRVFEILVTMLVQAIKDDDPGAFFVVAHDSHYVYGDGLNLEKLYRYMAEQAARIIMPNDFDSLDDLVKWTNKNLNDLRLPAISLAKTLVQVFEEEEAANGLS